MKNKFDLKQILTYVITFLVLISLFFFDSAKSYVEKKFSGRGGSSAIANTVKFYNRALEKTLNERKLDYLNDYATPTQRDLVSTYFAYDLKENRQIEVRLVEVDIDKQKPGKNKSYVWTSETWMSKYWDKNRTKIVFPEEKIVYKNKYELTKSEKKWLVSKIDILDEQHSPTQ